MLSVILAMAMACPPGTHLACRDIELPNGVIPHDPCNCINWLGEQDTFSNCAPEYGCQCGYALDCLYAFFTDFFNGEPCADIDGSGQIDPDDLSRFVSDWFICIERAVDCGVP